MARSVTVISGTDGLGQGVAASLVPWVLIAGVAGFVFWSTLSLRGRTE